jgi:cell division protein FtsB
VVPVAVEAIKQQQTRLETLEAENAELKSRLERLERLLQK